LFQMARSGSHVVFLSSWSLPSLYSAKGQVVTYRKIGGYAQPS
jgi:hypothetical protein